MEILDIILGLLLLYGLYKGIKNGLLVELASLIAVIAGLYGAIHFSYIVGEYLSENMDWDEKYMNTIAFTITFILIVILIVLIGKILTKIADFAMLGLLNKLAGAVFGTLKVAVILGALLVFFDKGNNQLGVVKPEYIAESKLYTPVKEIGAFVFSKVLKEAPLFNDNQEDEEENFMGF
ncbi:MULTISPECIES: CvpA family protein [Arenibacter]|uniref:CvpA family protein n=1 Tax=Arenibacter TaxID=178469 RepID=UPI000A373985|nr:MULTISPECIES: CvpA family protein [Arenibacter]